MHIPLSPDARVEFTQALEAMAGLSTEQIQAYVVDQLTPDKSPALFAAVFAENRSAGAPKP